MVVKKSTDSRFAQDNLQNTIYIYIVIALSEWVTLCGSNLITSTNGLDIGMCRVAL